MATIYKPRISGPSFLERSISNSPDLEVWSGASLVAVTSGTYTLFDSAGATVETGAATITASVASYTWTPGAGEALGSGYMEEWALVATAVTLPVFQRPAVICRRRPWPPLTNADILARQPKLTDYPTGETSWDPQIEDAWGVIGGRVALMADAYPDEVLNTWVFREICMLLALALIYELRATYVTGEAQEKADDYRQRFEAEWERATFDLDTDRDGMVETRGRGGERAQHPRSAQRVW